MSSRIPERVYVSSSAFDRCRTIQQRFPSLGTLGFVYRMAALISLKKNGYIEEYPDGIELNQRASISGVFEIFSPTRSPVLFPTLIQLVANRSLTLEEIYRQAAYHIHLGSSLLKDISDEATTIEELYKVLLDEVPESLIAASSDFLPDSEGLSVRIGDKLADNSAVHWPLTNTSVIENPHACIIGTSGQGKTQFALDILYQIQEQNPDVTFTILDYKGDLSESDSSNRLMLESRLRCEVITAGDEPIPTVPFRNTSTHDARQYAVGVADLLGNLYPRLGTQQRQALQQCIPELISDSGRSDGFGFPSLEDRVLEYYEDKRKKEDGLIEVLYRLSALRAFEDTPSDSSATPLIMRNLLIRLNKLAADSLPIAFLVIRRLYDEMRQLPEVGQQGSISNLTHIIFIDEAHHYLSVKNSPLARIIREGRSKGVAVFLATQSVSDLAGSAGSDYREFLSNSFFFKTNLNSSSEIRALVSTEEQNVRQIADRISTLEPGQMLFSRNLQRNARESILQAVQFYKRGLDS